MTVTLVIGRKKGGSVGGIILFEICLSLSGMLLGPLGDLWLGLE